MKFALLYFYDPAVAGPTTGEVEDWMAFDTEVKAAGVHVEESGFHSAEGARTVTVRDGAASTVAGPVLGSGDQIAGYWVVNVADADEAAAWATKIPTAAYGKVEVRQVVEF
jgi:hypothetical protein